MLAAYKRISFIFEGCSQLLSEFLQALFLNQMFVIPSVVTTYLRNVKCETAIVSQRKHGCWAGAM
jgi:hypothetical protein